jgi:hypothetical protein
MIMVDCLLEKELDCIRRGLPHSQPNKGIMFTSGRGRLVKKTSVFGQILRKQSTWSQRMTTWSSSDRCCESGRSHGYALESDKMQPRNVYVHLKTYLPLS